MKKFSVGVMLCSMMLLALPASAAVLTNTSWTVADFLGATPDYVADYTDTFDFAPTTIPNDGYVNSLVYRNADETLFGYAYNIYVRNGQPDEVSGLSVDFWKLVDNFSFFITDDIGTKAPTSASISGSEVLRFSFLFDELLPGQQSYWFGAFSTLPPSLRTANLLDSGLEASPKVLAPVPEPGMMLLLGSGLLGLAGLGRKKFRK